VTLSNAKDSGSLATALALLLVAPALAAADDFLWIEGEAAAASSVNRHSWYRSVKPALLSGGDWIAHFGGSEGTAAYRVEAPAAGRRVLWVRANPIQSSLSFRVGDGPWKAVDVSKAADRVNIASDDKPDLRYVAWIDAGPVELSKGAQTISFRFHSKNQNHGGLDCFVLASGPFRPRGSRKPGEKTGLADPGTWAFEPEDDRFDPAALLDLRGLNEETAGKSGWVRRTPEGGFAHGDGRPARFWAVNTTVQSSSDPRDLAHHARFLAKRGVNMVRFHGAIEPKGPDSAMGDVDLEEIDRCQRLVAAMKKEGIYTTISPYWAISARANPRWGLKGHPSGNLPGLLFWDDDLQAAYLSWIRRLLTLPNPHAGGVPLAKDPAMAIFQIQNEDSLLFWTLNSVKGEELERLRRHHGAWARKRHGSLEKALGAWGDLRVEGDDPERGSLGLLGLWEYKPDVSARRKARLADQMRYLAETMRSFNERVARFVRDELDCPVLVNAGNWRTANDAILLDAERWSYDACDVAGMNRYTTGFHRSAGESNRAGYLVQKGDLFTEASVLTEPWRLPTNVKQSAGHPFIIPEGAWVPPMRHQAEAPFLVAAYSALSGVDGYYWFSVGSPGFSDRLGKWDAASPPVLGGFPAAALLFRKGWVKPGRPVVHEERPLEDLFGQAPSAILETESFDPNRDRGEETGTGRREARAGAAHPLAFLVGRVEVVHGGDRSRTRVEETAGRIDEEKKVITSGTGELELDYGRGICALDAPRAQGACGFLSRGAEIELGALRISSKSEYAAILAVPLDDRELKTSRKVLIQVTAACRPHGWRESDAEIEVEGKSRAVRRIDDTGGAPWNVAEVEAEISLKNPQLRKATLLDPNGMPARAVPCRSEGGVLSLELPRDAMYIVLE